MSKELTKQDRCDFNFHRAVIRRNKESVIDTAKSLKAIRDRKLWRGTHESYEDFCQVEYGHGLRWANNLVAPPKLPDENSPNGGENDGLGTISSKNGPDDTKNAVSGEVNGARETNDTTKTTESAPGATENGVSGESEGAPSKPKSSPPDPFQKLDDLIGKAIRATDDIGVGEHHDRTLKLLGDLLAEVKRWRAAA